MNAQTKTAQPDRELTWINSRWFETADGYSGGYSKLKGVSLDGYMAVVYAPGWSYSARCPNVANARAWCRKTVINDRRDPLVRNTPSDWPAPKVEA